MGHSPHRFGAVLVAGDPDGGEVIGDGLGQILGHLLLGGGIQQLLIFAVVAHKAAFRQGGGVVAGAGDIIEAVLAAPVGIAHGGIQGAVYIIGKGLREGIEVIGLVPLGGGAGGGVAVDAEEELGVLLFRQGNAGGQLHLAGTGGINEINVGAVAVLQNIVQTLCNLEVHHLFWVGGQVPRRAAVRAAVAGIDDDAGSFHGGDVVEAQGKDIAAVGGPVAYHAIVFAEGQGQLLAAPGSGGEKRVFGEVRHIAAHRLGVGKVEAHAAGGIGGVVAYRLGHGEDDIGVGGGAGDGHPLDDVILRLLGGGGNILGIDPLAGFQEVVAEGAVPLPVDNLIPQGIVQRPGGKGEAVGAGDVVHGVAGEGLRLAGLYYHRLAGADDRLLIHRHRGPGGSVGKAFVGAAEGDGPQLLGRGGGLRRGEIPGILDVGGGLIGVIPFRLGFHQGDGAAPQGGGDGGTGVGVYRNGNLHAAVNVDAAGGGHAVLIQHLHLPGDVVGDGLPLVGKDKGIKPRRQLLGDGEIAILVGGNLLVVQCHLIGRVAGPLEHDGGLVGGVGGLLRLGELKLGKDKLGAGLVV